MLLITTDNVNPAFNLATEEFLLKEKKEDIFFLWRNAPSIIIGKNQNAYSEIDIDYVEKNNITVIRRLTGGGAVFHDLGNICFTFIENVDNESDTSFAYFTMPIVNFLKEKGLNASLSGRNDIMIDDKKVSGNAQTKYKNRFMHHGTLLFDTNLNNLSNALKVNPLKIQSKGIKSVKSRVVNISSLLEEKMSPEIFMQNIYDYAKYLGTPYTLSESDNQSIQKLYNEKYSRWEWNFKENPDYDFKNEKKFDGGIIEVRMNISKETIKDILISGDFLGILDIEDLCKKLKGLAHNKQTISKALEKINLAGFLGNITKEEFLSVLF